MAGLAAQGEQPKQPPATCIVGTLIDPQATAPGKRQIVIRSVGDGKEMWVPVDDEGSFRSAALAPGAYQVQLKVTAAPRMTTRFTGDGKPVFEQISPTTLTWLGDADIDAGQTLLTEGSAARVRVPAPTLSTIEVLVTADSKPVAGADVFSFRLYRESDAVTRSGPRGIMQQNPDDANAASRHPCVRTGADGRARFVAAGAGSWEFYLRHADGGATTGPHPITVTAGATAQLALQLPTSTIRGSFRHPPHANQRRVRAQLYRRTMADDSPFTWHDLGRAQEGTVPCVELGADGSFAFPWLPAEAWVVRIACAQLVGWDAILAQRTVTTDGAGEVDLGDLARAPTFAVSLAYGVERGPPRANVLQALQVQWLPPDGGLPVFVANEWLSRSRLELTHLAPGRYRTRHLTDDSGAGSWGVGGRPYGAALEFTVDAVGKPQPAHLF